MDEMLVEDAWEQPISTDKHKEEGHCRTLLDKTDRMKIQYKLDNYPHPLKKSTPDNLFNIVSGQVVERNVNVHNAFSSGECMVADFKASLPAVLTLSSLRL